MSSLPVLLVTISCYLAIVVENAHVRKPFAVFDGLDCSKFDPNYIEVMECWLMPDSNGQLTMNAILVLKQDLSHVRCNYNFTVEHNTRNMTYLSMDIDICGALGGVFRNPILSSILTEVRRIGNFPIECPLKKGFKYVLNNFTINSKLLPSFTPVLKWTSNSNFYTTSTKNIVLQYDNNGRVIHKPGRS